MLSNPWVTGIFGAFTAYVLVSGRKGPEEEEPQEGEGASGGPGED